MSRQTKSPLSLYLDFDSTLTEHDTLSALSSTVHKHRPSALPTLPPFSTFTEAYFADLEEYHRNPHNWSSEPGQEPFTPLVAELARLRNLRPVENASLNRLGQVGWFQGLTAAGIAADAREAVEKRDVVLRKGWAELVRTVQQDGGSVAILSVNWSRRWVRECLRADLHYRVGEAKLRQGAKIDVDAIEIVANELEGLDEPEGTTSGRILGTEVLGGDRIMTSTDKKKVLDALRQRNTDHQSGRTGTRIYVGDSVTDLECLLIVDVAITIREDEQSWSSGQRELADTLRLFDTRVDRIDEYDEGADKGIVWWATDFEEITKALKIL
ncbi:MAG: hypothetical protein M4579_003580 [Chaenotheca gracillima]|nr:MAG: hypothetical protein M4579_003580 [Chaenotheca gracillima]